jgi:hypothetical protein
MVFVVGEDDSSILMRLLNKPAADAPREEHERFANENNFFWLPCPRCGRMFGGHEVAQRNTGGRLWESPTSGQMTCPECPGQYNTHLRDGLPPPAKH